MKKNYTILYGILFSILSTQLFGGVNFDKLVQEGTAASTEVAHYTTVDKFGNQIVAGTFTDETIIGNKALESRGKTDIYIAKYKANGDCSWVLPIGGVHPDKVTKILSDAQGNTYVTGTVRETVWVGYTLISQTKQGNNSNNSETFLLKLDQNGKVVWYYRFIVNTLNGIGSNRMTDMVLNHGENKLIMSGHTNGGYMVKGTNGVFTGATSVFHYDGVVSKFNVSDGSLDWHASVRSHDGEVILNSVAVDEQGVIYFAGKFGGKIVFGGSTIMALGEITDDVLLGKFSKDGDPLNVIRSGGLGEESFYKLKYRNNQLYVVGVIDGNGYFGNAFVETTYLNFGKKDIVLATYSNALVLTNIKVFGGVYDQYPVDLHVDGSGNVYLAGIFTYSFIYDGFVAKNNTKLGANADFHKDAYIIKLKPNWELAWGKVIAGKYNNAVTSMMVKSGIQKSIYLSGSFQDVADFDGQPLINNGQLNDESEFPDDAFMVKIVENNNLTEGVSQAHMIYPNPNIGTFKLKLSGLRLDGNVLQVITDQLGAIVYQDQFMHRGTDISLKLTGIDRGLYYVKVQQDDQIYTERLIIE